MATVQEYLTELRQDILDDDDGTKLWSDAQLVRYLNNTLREIGRRREQIYDDTGDLNITVVSGTQLYYYDSCIYTLEDLTLASNQKPLIKKTYEWLGRTQKEWRNDEGTPTHYVENPTEGSIVLWPKPDAADTLYVKAYRVPRANYSSSQLTASVTEPADSIYHDAIIVGMAMYAYKKHDADSFDSNRQAVYAEQFTQLVGPPISARELLARKENANLNISIHPYPYAPRIKHRRSFHEGESTEWS